MNDFVFLLVAFFILSSHQKVQYVIDEESKVTLNVNTNLMEVNCKCLNQADFGNPKLAEFKVTQQQIKFSDTSLKLDVKNINCKNRGINNDLRETLSVDKNPYIILELSSVRDLENLSYDVKKNVDVKTFVSISGKKIPQTIHASIQKTESDQLRLKARKNISLQQYGINPKSSLKFVKIKDNVEIIVDLVISVNK